MCVSPAYMTEQELKKEIDWLKTTVTSEEPFFIRSRVYYGNRLAQMQEVLQFRFPQPEGLDIGKEERFIEVVPLESPESTPESAPEPAEVPAESPELVPV